jgi:hypothetical protein
MGIKKLKTKASLTNFLVFSEWLWWEKQVAVSWVYGTVVPVKHFLKSYDADAEELKFWIFLLLKIFKVVKIVQ